MNQHVVFPAPPVEDFKVAMRSLAATVTLVTAGREGNRSGLAVTATCSLSMEPPSMVVCVNQSSNTHDRIVEEGHFAVNLLSDADDHQDLVMLFSDASRVGEEKFASAQWLRIGDSAPLLADTLASIDCKVVNSVQIGTHTLFIGEVRKVLNHPQMSPLLYANRQFATLAASSNSH